jgi:hypothetical protein
MKQGSNQMVEANAPLRFESKSGIMEIFTGKYIKYTLSANKPSPDIEDMQLELNFLKQSLNGEKLPFLIDNRTLKKLDPKVLNFMQLNSPKFASKIAVIVSPGISKFLFHIILFLKKPPFPMKLFKNEKEAIKWLLVSNEK